ncbi:MAG TPA: SLC13 family permease [Trebonia sp.]|jgi:arsenical pump membrane protein|nr:SLC13 family permease [Trebonia sp.]
MLRRTAGFLGRNLGVLDWIAVALLAAGLAFTATGLLPSGEASATVRRILPILLFLATILVLAELTATAGVFDFAARRLAIAARGNFALLFACCVAFAAVTTIGLNLDTTAVLLTPVMLALARTLREPGTDEPVPALPLAMCTVWLANTASLLLPVSNLTNLLAQGRVGLSPAGFATRMGPAQAAALAVTAVLLWAFYWRRGRRGARRYEPPVPYLAPDRWLFRIAAAACLFFIAALLGGVELGVASAIAAAAVAAAFAIRDRTALRWSLIPWRLPVFVTGLFLVVQTISLHLQGPLTAMVSSSGGALGTFRAAGAGALLANVLNNLPAYVAGEAVIPGPNHTQLLGLLIGVNVGPVITPWASLATLLWYERCVSSGVAIPLRRFMATSACLAVAGMAASVAALLWL